MFDDRHADKLIDRTQTTWPSRSLVLMLFVQTVFWAVVAWFVSRNDTTSPWAPVGFALFSSVWAFQFWLIVTNWRGWAQRFGNRRSGNSNSGYYVRPQSQYMQTAARIVVPLAVLSDVVIIVQALVR